MKRRVVEQGGLTLMVSLPRKWAKKFKLTKGDEIEIVEKGKELILSTAKAVEEKKPAIVEIKDPKRFMGRLLHAPYRFGYNNIEIKYTDPAVVPKIQHYLDQLLGFEIVEQGPNYMKVEMVAKELETEFEKMLRRILLIASQMLKELSIAAKQNDKAKFNEIATMEVMNNKLTNFCERMLNKHGYAEVGKTSFMYCTVWTMEQIADEIKYTAQELIEIKNISKKTTQLIDKTSQLFELFTKIFYKQTTEDMWLFRQNQKNIIKELDNIESKTEFKPSSYIKSIANKLKHLSLFL